MWFTTVQKILAASVAQVQSVSFLLTNIVTYSPGEAAIFCRSLIEFLSLLALVDYQLRMVFRPRELHQVESRACYEHEKRL